MKSLALLAALLGLLVTGSLGVAAGTRQQHPVAAVANHSWLSLRLPFVGLVRVREDASLLQTGGTATPTPSTPTPGTPTPTTPTPVATGTTTVTPTPTATTSPYPDPVNVLNSMIQVYSLIQTSHFDLITNGVQTGAETLHINAVGDASCKGPSLHATVTASDVRSGVGTSKLNYQMIQIKKKYYIKWAKSKNKWTPTKAATTNAFGFSIANPLICTTSGSASSGNGSGNTTLKDVLNLGPSTFQGQKVWHIRATEVATSTNGQTQQARLDFLISQAHFYPYVFTVSINDTSQHVKLVEKQVLTKFGEKVTVKAPKKGSTKP